MRRSAVSVLASMGLITGLALAFQPPAPPAPTPPDSQPKQPERPARAPGERGPGERGERGERGPGERRQGEGEARLPSVEGAMKGMGRAMRSLRRQIDDPAKKDENIKLINDMQRACTYAKSQPLPPEFLKDAKDDAAKAKRAASYHEKLIEAMRLMLDAEADLHAGKFADAKRSLEEVVDMRDDIHKELGVKED